MHQNSFMCRTHPNVSNYKEAPHFQPLADIILLSFNMDLIFNFALVSLFLNVVAIFPDFKIPPNYTKLQAWKVLHRNSSGQLFWKVGTQNPCFLAWQPRQRHNGFIRPSFYYETPPAPTNSSETTTEVNAETTSRDLKLDETTLKNEVSNVGKITPVHSAMEVLQKPAQLTPETPDFSNQLFSHSTLVSHLITMLNPKTR